MSYSYNGKIFADLYNQLTEKDMERFSLIVNKLFGETFIIRTLDNNDYYSCLRHLSLLKAYFSMSDYEVNHDETNGIIFISTTKNKNRVRLSKFETILALLLRIKYFNGYKSVSQSEQIIVQLDNLAEEVRLRNIYTKEKSLREYNEALKTLKRYKIVDFPRGDLKADSGVAILPTILHIITNEILDEIEVRLDSYKKDSEDEYEETYEN